MGNMTFIAQIYLSKIIKNNTLSMIIKALFEFIDGDSSQEIISNAYEGLVKLFELIGQKLDHEVVDDANIDLKF